MWNEVVQEQTLMWETYQRYKASVVAWERGVVGGGGPSAVRIFYV
jgi:hypothetical protein